MLTLAAPSSLRLMMSKSKSLLRPSVLLRTMCPVSPSHCACRKGDAEGERGVGDSLECRRSSVCARSPIEAPVQNPRRRGEGDRGGKREKMSASTRRLGDSHQVRTGRRLQVVLWYNHNVHESVCSMSLWHASSSFALVYKCKRNCTYAC